MRSYLERVRGGLVVFDGGTGTSFQDAGLTTNDFGGLEFDGCMEILNVARPDVVESLHRSFFDVGVDVVATNTFGGFAVPLAEYGPEDRSYELSAAGAAVARGVVDKYHDGDGR